MSSSSTTSDHLEAAAVALQAGVAASVLDTKNKRLTIQFKGTLLALCPSPAARRRLWQKTRPLQERFLMSVETHLWKKPRTTHGEGTVANTLEVDNRSFSMWHDLGGMGGGMVDGAHYSSKECCFPSVGAGPQVCLRMEQLWRCHEERQGHHGW